ATDNARRMALSMAVLTQVRVSVERYKLAVYDYQIAQESARVDQRLASISRAGSDNSLSSDLESLRTQARSIVSRFQEAASYAQAQSAYGRVLNSVGIDLLPEKVTSSDLPTLSREINQSLVAGEKQVFTQSADAVVSRHPVSVTLGRLPAGVNKSAIYQSVTHVLAANQLVQGNGADSVKLQMNLNLERASGSQRGVWEMAVYNAQGAQVAYQKYTSYLPNDVNTRSVSALAEAAALSVVSDLHKAAGDTGVMTASNP
ncbi:TolC family protein, partial [Enterobacter hormaechei]